jgi:cytidyltransferase-like protein
MIKVAVCGAFDPDHEGHLDHILKASRLGDWLIILVSNREQLILKKGEEVLPLRLRMAKMRKVLQMLGGRGEVRACLEKDTTDCAISLRKLRPDIYAKGGDRTPENMSRAEIEACAAMGCQIVYGVGDLLNSSTAIVNQIRCQHLPGARSHPGHFVIAFDIDGVFQGYQGSVTAEQLSRLHRENTVLGILCSRDPDSSAKVCWGMSIYTPPEFIRQCEVDHRAPYLRQLANDIRRQFYVYVGDREVDKQEALRAGWDFYYHWEIDKLISRVESTPYKEDAAI